MELHGLTTLKLARYRLHLRSLEDATLPLFLGSTLRGAFGHALKKSVCLMSHRNCAQCLVADQCIYPYLFETPTPPEVLPLRGQQQAPHPFILSPPILHQVDEDLCNAHKSSGPDASQDNMASLNFVEAYIPLARHRHLAAGDEIIFDLMLIGRAIDYLPYVVFTVSEMAHTGLGVKRARFELSSVEALTLAEPTEIIYTKESGRIAQHSSVASLTEMVTLRLRELPRRDALDLKFLSPTRIRIDGEPQARLDFYLLIRNLLRRVSLLNAVHGDTIFAPDYTSLLTKAAQITTQAQGFRWWDWDRYSNRQRTKIKMGGFIGPVRYAGESLEDFMPLVVAGELLGIGAGTSFGLGKYQIVA
jgi:hypothetical protein